MANAAKPRDSFYEVLNAAINDMMEFGFDSQARIDEWVLKLDVAARASLVPEAELQKSMREVLVQAYDRIVGGGQLNLRHQGLSEFTLARIKPKLRAELDRRILANADLIKLNRKASVQKVLQRFQGWATSIPLGGTRVADRSDVRKSIRKSLTSLPFEERRVLIDQGHKLTASVSKILAVDGGAIAAIWHHLGEGPWYQARPEHVDRDKVIFVLRDNWALEKGFMKLAGRKYTDQVTEPGEEPFCGCQYEYIYHLRDLPPEMITAKGRESLEAARLQLASRTNFHHGLH